jgi:hypothetical protein
MIMGNERNDQIKLQIDAALSQHHTRQAVLIVQAILCGIDLIDEQSPAVVQALIDYGRKKASEDKGTRRDIDLALNKYCEKALVEAKKRERQLLSGIMGNEEDSTSR